MQAIKAWRYTLLAAGTWATMAVAWTADCSATTLKGGEHKRLCKQRIEWTATAGTRAQAQRKAVDGWSAAAAGQHGEAFTRWDIAGVARIACTLTPEGHRCRAAASPCRDLNEGAQQPKR